MRFLKPLIEFFTPSPQRKLLWAILHHPPEAVLRQRVRDFVKQTPCLTEENMGLLHGALNRLDGFTPDLKQRVGFIRELLADRPYDSADRLVGQMTDRLTGCVSELAEKTSPLTSFKFFYRLHRETCATRTELPAQIATANAVTTLLDKVPGDKTVTQAAHLMMFATDKQLPALERIATNHVLDNIDSLILQHSPVYAVGVLKVTADGDPALLPIKRQTIAEIITALPGPFLKDTPFLLQKTMHDIFFAADTEPGGKRTEAQEELLVMGHDILPRLARQVGDETVAPLAHQLNSLAVERKPAPPPEPAPQVAPPAEKPTTLFTRLAACSSFLDSLRTSIEAFKQSGRVIVLQPA
jgi:hypothetical protein